MKESSGKWVNEERRDEKNVLKKRQEERKRAIAVKEKDVIENIKGKYM